MIWRSSKKHEIFFASNVTDRFEPGLVCWTSPLVGVSAAASFVRRAGAVRASKLILKNARHRPVRRSGNAWLESTRWQQRRKRRSLREPEIGLPENDQEAFRLRSSLGS